jgi:hypothetical protein
MLCSPVDVKQRSYHWLEVLTGFPGSHPGQGKKEAFANLE